MRTYAVSAFLLFCGAATAGILITTTDKGLQFTDAFAITVNGKDKALAMGTEPKISGQLKKLPSTHLDRALIKDVSSNSFALYGEEGPNYILPEGLPKNATGDPASLWKTARIAAKKASNDKAPADVPVATFVAFLPGGAEELSKLCLDQRALGILGGKEKILETQLQWIAATARAYAANPAMAALKKYVERVMRQQYEQFETGTAAASVLLEGLKFADLSQAIYADAPEQAQLRKDLRDRKAWLDRKIAILLAFGAGEEWDAFLIGDRDFERFQQAFPEMLAKHKEALKKSLQFHSEAGDARQKDGEYGAAYREFRLAAMRNPSDPILQQKTAMAWTEYSSQVASEHQRDRKQLKLSERDAITQALDFASRYREANKLDEAMKSVQEAERVDPESLAVILKRAEVLGAQRKYTEALKALDEYDKRAVGDERAKAASLRTDLLFKRKDTVETARADLGKALAESRFHRFRDLVFQALRAKGDDAELLYYAGLASLTTRNTKQGREYLTRYLEISNTLDADEKQRAKARSTLVTITENRAVERGEPSWMSGQKVPKGTFYDPISLAFLPKVDHIEASNKLKVTYQWTGERLRSVTPVFEKPDHATGERKISFAYEDRVPQIASVAYEDAARAPSSLDPDDLLKGSSLVLINNPYADPIAIQNLTGKNITLAVSGNKFFHPFVWDKIHYFKLAYDEKGRVSQAREVSESGGFGGDTLLEFEWDGSRLMAVRGYQGDDKRRAKVYERTLQYQDERLIAESIQSQGKPSHIKYNYNGNRLISAECGTDFSLDGRGRKVMFLASSGN